METHPPPLLSVIVMGKIVCESLFPDIYTITLYTHWSFITKRGDNLYFNCYHWCYCRLPLSFMEAFIARIACNGNIFYLLSTATFITICIIIAMLLKLWWSEQNHYYFLSFHTRIIQFITDRNSYGWYTWLVRKLRARNCDTSISFALPAFVTFQAKICRRIMSKA